MFNSFEIYEEKEFEHELPNGWVASGYARLEMEFARQGEDSDYKDFSYSVDLLANEEGDEIPVSSLTIEMKDEIESAVFNQLEKKCYESAAVEQF